MNEATLLATIPPRFSAEPRTLILFEAIETNMGMKRENLECQLNRASTELSACEKQLDQNGVAAAGRALNPKWRNLSARCRQLRRRLIAVTRVEANNVEVTQRKEAKSAGTASAS